MAELNWPAQSVEMKPLDSLTAYAGNARTHTDKQITQVAKSMREWGWTNPVLVDEDGMIIAGHCRVMAALQCGYTEAPVMTARGWTPAQKAAYVLADNQLALNSGWDNDAIDREMEGLREWGFDTELIGFPDLADIPDDLDEDIYTRKVESPVYEIKGDCPEVGAIFDAEKTERLRTEIAEADLPEDITQFLTYAAARHTVFDFSKVAEFYAHASADVQRLMEDSALVVIDYEQAIEQGFVKLSDKMTEIVGNDERILDAE